MYITLFYLVTLDSLLSVRDHFLFLYPTELTVDLLEERLTAAKTSIVTVGASLDDPRAPFFEGCSPVPLLPSVGSAAAVDLINTEEVGAASAPSGRRRSGKGKGGKGGRGDDGGSGGGGGQGGGVGSGGGGGGGSGGVGGVGGGGGGSGSGSGVGGGGGAGWGGAAEALGVASESNTRVPVRPRRPSSFVSGTQGVGVLGCWSLRLCIEAAALGASVSAAPGPSESALSSTVPTEALHTFTPDSGASYSFFRDRTTLMLLSRPVAVSLADPSGGPVLSHSSTVLPCPAFPFGSLSGLHIPSFSTNLVSGADL
ncbi:unnamed protein product [Closterium sp. NIES-64]|nr:unnamed protein product [Closterium sp. NIES-64]